MVFYLERYLQATGQAQLKRRYGDVSSRDVAGFPPLDAGVLSVAEIVRFGTPVLGVAHCKEPLSSNRNFKTTAARMYLQTNLGKLGRGSPGKRMH